MDEEEIIPKPMFGGTRAIEFERICDKVERLYKQSLEKIISIQHAILDVRIPSWYDDINAYRLSTRDIEVNNFLFIINSTNI